MEQEQDIIEGNKLIAEFDGWIYSKSGRTVRENNYSSPYRIKDIKYHSSWDWLMPVVEKIEALDYNISVVIKENKCGIYQSKGTPYEYCISRYEADTKIGATVLAILETIKWYNNQNK